VAVCRFSFCKPARMTFRLNRPGPTHRWNFDRLNERLAGKVSFRMASVKVCITGLTKRGIDQVYSLSITFTGNCVDFEDSLNVTPRQPYNPSLQPDRTILKPSPVTTQLEAPKAMKRKSLRTRLCAADFF